MKKTALIMMTVIMALMSMIPVASAHDGININEIMYNPPGADPNHEWLELYNNGTTDIDVRGWRLYEAGINHRLTLYQGSMVIPAGGYAIIADNEKVFLNEHPECICTVMDSEFSLGDRGEYIALRKATLNIVSDFVDEVTYNASWGADGNGKTLKLNLTGGWGESRVDGGTPCHRNSVLGTINLMVNATDTNGNYNDTVNITLAVKETNGAGIPFPVRMPMISLSNITFDAIIRSPGNIEGHRRSSCMLDIAGIIQVGTMNSDSWEFGVYDKQTNWSIDLHGALDNINENAILKRLETRKERAEVANLSFDPMYVMLDFPLWIGKNWTSTSNVTGRLVDETGVVIPIDSFAVVSGAVTDAIENIISFEVEGELVSCLLRYNIPVSYPTGYTSNNRDSRGISLSNITFDAIIPRPKNIEKHPVSSGSSWSHKELVFHSLESYVLLPKYFAGYLCLHNEWELRDSTIYGYTKMTGMSDNVTKEPKMDWLVIELEPGVEIANLSFDPMFELFYFPLYVGKNWTATTNVTGILVNETGAVIPIDSFAVVAGAVIEEVEVIDEMDQTPTFGLVIEVNICFEVEGAPVSCLIKYWLKEPPILYPRDLCDDLAEREEGVGGA